MLAWLSNDLTGESFSQTGRGFGSMTDAGRTALIGGISSVIASASEAIQKPRRKNWIASSRELLAMTELAIPNQPEIILL
jgi:hypothetical protein